MRKTIASGIIVLLLIANVVAIEAPLIVSPFKTTIVYRKCHSVS